MKATQRANRAKPGTKSLHFAKAANEVQTGITDRELDKVSGGPLNPPNIRIGT